MIHVYYGDGKGKTTAAMGLALRALAAGMRVCIVQFLKDGTSGEAAALAAMPGVALLSDGATAKFSFQMDESERTASRKLHDENLCEAMRLVREGACDLLVLDEALDAVNAELVDEALLREAVALGMEGTSRQRLEVVVTGHRRASDGTTPGERFFAWLIDRADYVTQMRCEKHPYAAGVAARKGIEY